MLYSSPAVPKADGLFEIINLITGYNHNVKYKDQVFHVQTEDVGDKNPVIVTYLFFRGNVITSRKTDYSAVPKDEKFEETVKNMMQEQHKGMIRDLVKGEFDGLDTLKMILPKPKTLQDAPLKSSVYKIYDPDKKEEKLDIDSRQEEKSLDEMILEYLSEKKD